MKMKAQIRGEILDKLSHFEAQEKAFQTNEITEKFLASRAFQSADSIGLYMNTKIEFDLSTIFQAAKDAGKQILIPKTYPKRQLAFLPYEESKLKRTNFGLFEPISGLKIQPDLIVVPGLAWNSEGFRVGYGAGYYDRYLANFGGETASLVYDFQRQDFEPEDFDLAVKEIFSV